MRLNYTTRAKFQIAVSDEDDAYNNDTVLAIADTLILLLKMLGKNGSARHRYKIQVCK